MWPISLPIAKTFSLKPWFLGAVHRPNAPPDHQSNLTNRLWGMSRDRSKNNLTFGLKDKAGCLLDGKVAELFEYLGEKILFFAQRLGDVVHGNVSL